MCSSKITLQNHFLFLAAGCFSSSKNTPRFILVLISSHYFCKWRWCSVTPLYSTHHIRHLGRLYSLQTAHVSLRKHQQRRFTPMSLAAMSAFLMTEKGAEPSVHYICTELNLFVPQSCGVLRRRIIIIIINISSCFIYTKHYISQLFVKVKTLKKLSIAL